jgi:hypothetical protein
VICATAPARGRCHALWRAAVALVVCVAMAGCAGGPSFAELFDDSAAGEGTGIQGAALVRAVVILARHKATPQQHAVAERNARAAVAKMEREIAAERPRTVAKKKPTPAKKKSTASAGAKPGSAPKKTAGAPAPPPAAEPESEPESAPARPAKKLPKRIAIPTVKDENTAPGASVAAMIYDVEARRMVSDEVYDLASEPRSGETVKFEAKVVRYVGSSDY